MASKFEKDAKFFVVYNGSVNASQKFATKKEAVSWAGLQMLKQPGIYFYILEAIELVEPVLPSVKTTKIV